VNQGEPDLQAVVDYFTSILSEKKPSKPTELERPQIPHIPDFESADPSFMHKPPPRPRKQQKQSKGDQKQHFTDLVQRIVQSCPQLRAVFQTGWEALWQVWGIGWESFDEAVLQYLQSKTAQQQEQIILKFASTELSTVQNLSAYLNSLIREHDQTPQVCIYFLAGCCAKPECSYVHPCGTEGWDTLEERWGITFKQLDYNVLNYLAKKPLHQQDTILLSFASMDLTKVKNLSAYLSTVVLKFEQSRSKQGRDQYKAMGGAEHYGRQYGGMGMSHRQGKRGVRGTWIREDEGDWTMDGTGCGFGYAPNSEGMPNYKWDKYSAGPWGMPSHAGSQGRF